MNLIWCSRTKKKKKHSQPMCCTEIPLDWKDRRLQFISMLMEIEEPSLSGDMNSAVFLLLVFLSAIFQFISIYQSFS